MSQSSDWYGKSPCKTEVCNFYCLIFINKDILRFQVSVDYPSGVTEIQCCYDLEHYFLKYNK